MNNAISVILTLVYIAIVATLVIKKVNSVFVFLMTGMGVLLIASLVTGTSVLGVDSTSGNLLIDVFVFSKDTFSSNLSGIGLTLMMITGYAMYMSHIGAYWRIYKASLSGDEAPFKNFQSLYCVGHVVCDWNLFEAGDYQCCRPWNAADVNCISHFNFYGS